MFESDSFFFLVKQELFSNSMLSLSRGGAESRQESVQVGFFDLLCGHRTECRLRSLRMSMSRSCMQTEKNLMAATRRAKCCRVKKQLSFDITSKDRETTHGSEKRARYGTSVQRRRTSRPPSSGGNVPPTQRPRRSSSSFTLFMIYSYIIRGTLIFFRVAVLFEA